MRKCVSGAIALVLLAATGASAQPAVSLTVHIDVCRVARRASKADQHLSLRTDGTSTSSQKRVYLFELGLIGGRQRLEFGWRHCIKARSILLMD